ncbi:MAG: N-acetyltransferase [Clostridiales bacterium]|nr:N-acetyltransferase [Clostridiales bacterium]
MISIRIATKDDIEYLMSSRLEMLKVVNSLSEDYVYSEEMIKESRDYFLNGDIVIGCASMSFMRIMPTFDHPTGRRGVTEISLDATASGRPLYESMGFKASTECMVLTKV